MNLYSEETLQKKAIRYMEKKYGNDVKFSVEMAYVEGGIYNIYLNVEEHEGWKVLTCWNYETKEFTDNYMSWVFQEQVEEAFYPLFHEVYGNCKIFNEPYGFQASDHYNKDTKLGDYLNTINASNLYLFTASDTEKKEEDVQKICDLIETKGWDADITIMYVSEETLMDINHLSYEKFFKGHYILRSSVMVLKDKENYIGRWREGSAYE